MTYIRIFILANFFILTLSTTWAREKTPEYVVYQVIGKCTKVSGNKIAALKKGDFLNSPDVVNLQDGATLILVCANYKAFQLNAKGKYPVSTMKKYCAKNNGSFTANYFRFVWDELTHPHSSPEAEPEKYMKTAGAVTRGTDLVGLKIVSDTIKFYRNDFGIKFTSIKEKVTINYSSSLNPGATLISQKAAGFVSFTEFAKSNQPPGIYYWQITNAKYKKGNLYVLEVMDEQVYKKKVKEITAKVIGSNLAERAFMTGFLLEGNYFLGEAQKYYKLAVKLNPKNTAYKTVSSRFTENGSFL